MFHEAKRVRSGLVQERAATNSCRDAEALICRNSHAQNTLHSHRMATVTPVLEEAAGTVPFTIIEVGGVDIILASERRLEASELDPFGLFCVTLGFCNLMDHA